MREMLRHPEGLTGRELAVQFADEDDPQAPHAWEVIRYAGFLKRGYDAGYFLREPFLTKGAVHPVRGKPVTNFRYRCRWQAF